MSQSPAHWRASRLGRRAVCAALLLHATVACSPQADQSAPPELIDVVADLNAPPPELDYAAQIATRDCMAKAGFTLPAPVLALPERLSTYLGLVGVFRTEAQARSVGYATTMKTTEETSQRFEESLPPSKRASYMKAYTGGDDAKKAEGTTSQGMVISEPAAGCYGAGISAVYGSVADKIEGDVLYNDSRGVLGEQQHSLSPGDGQAYQQCMSEAGYRVDGFNAFKVAGERFGRYRSATQPPNPQETAMAVADFGCQDQVGVLAKMREHYAKRAGDWVVAHEQQLLAWKETVRESLTRAKKIIDG